MANQDALFTTLIEGLAQLNKRLTEEETTSEEIILELKQFESEYAKEIKIINDRLDSSAILTDRLVKEAISKLPKPKDPQKIDYSVVEKYLDEELKTLTKNRALETTKIKDEIVALVEAIPIPQDGEDGSDGKDATDKQVSNAVTKWVDENIDLLKGSDGKDGKSIRGLDGKSGSDGVGIEDIIIEKEYLVITLTNGEEKRLKMPKITKYFGSGGGSSVDTTKYDAHIKRDELLNLFNPKYPTSYKKPTKDGSGNIIKLEIFVDRTESIPLFSKDITYTNGNPTLVVITSHTTNQTATKTIFYDENGDYLDNELVVA
ncbi:MAG: hypothetical protein U9O83_01145 [Campylobacterota bacterium]|nr:hypothetical protein [Campylobacterota bacterium]